MIDSNGQGKDEHQEKRTTTHSLTPTQKTYWTLRQIPGVGGRLNGCNIIYVRGPKADPLELARLVDRVLERHPALHARFPMVEGRPAQCFDHPPPPAVVRDLLVEVGPQTEDAARDAREARAKELLETLQSTPFDLATGPVVRALALRIHADITVVSWAISHIVTDLHSARVLFEDFVADLAGRESVPLSVGSTFIETVDRSKRDPLADRFPERMTFWTEELKDVAVIDLKSPIGEGGTTSLPPPSSGSAIMVEDYAFPIGADVTERLRSAAATKNVTPYTLVLNTFGDVLREERKQSGKVALGFVTANRTPRDINVVGCFAQSLPVVIDLSWDPAKREAEARAAVRRSLENALPLADISRATYRLNAFNVLLNDAVPRSASVSSVSRASQPSSPSLPPYLPHTSS
jgi:hypothetical protein